MDRFLTHTFSITDHPIMKLDVRFKSQYVLGLGEFLSYIAYDDERVKLLFEVWCSSILGEIPDKVWHFAQGWPHIKEALRIKRAGFSFFTMRHPFIFDCFYLLESAHSELIHKAYIFLSNEIGGFFTKRIIMDIYHYFKGESEDIHVAETLKKHRELNRTFHKKPLKRVLVVATMSAGKSTLINAITGFRLNRVKTTACTSKLCYIYNKPYQDGIVINTGENKFVYSTDTEFSNSDSFTSAALHFNSSLSKENICFIDTPGSNYSNDSTHGEITHEAIQSNDYDMVLFVANSQYFAAEDENKLLDFTIEHARKPIIFVLNQLDRFKQREDSIKKMFEDFERILREKRISQPVIAPLSAQGALLIKQAQKLDEDQVYELEKLTAKFSNEYYFLERFYKQNEYIPEAILNHTGIFQLENLIIKCNETDQNQVQSVFNIY